MSEQILLQGKLLGTEGFLASRSGPDEDFAARALWVALISEVLPRALLAELELAPLLLGSSGGGQFLVVLPDTAHAAAEQFLSAAAKQLDEATGHRVRPIWAFTENLGDWTVVRKRLNEQLDRARNAPLARERNFAPIDAIRADAFDVENARQLPAASSVGWSPGLPGIISAGHAKHNWNLTPNLSVEGITVARHSAPDAGASEFAHRAQGRPLWGVLRGDVDNFGVRLRRLHSIEEHVRLSVMYKQFFAGELQVLCSMPDFWQKIGILYSGGDDFAVWGAWDALVLLAREMQRIFQRFAEENLNDFPGAEAKTITMAVAISNDPAQPLTELYERAGGYLALAKAADKDCIYLMDRILEWKQLSDAAELKDAVLRISEEFRSGRHFLAELRALYQKVSSSFEAHVDHERLLRRAYRFQRRYSRMAASSRRDLEFQKLRAHLINEIVGRNVKPAAGKRFRIRPAGVVALEWARLSRIKQGV